MRTRAYLVALTAAAALPAALAGPALAHGRGGTVFVTERQLGSVTAFDAASGAALWTSPTGATPIGITQPHGTRKVYTSDEGANAMSVFDRRAGTPLGTIPTGPAPHHLMASRDGRSIYVAEFGSGSVGVVDTAADAEIARFAASALPTARTHAAFVTRDGADLYTANTRAVRSDPGDVAHLDARSGRLLCSTDVGVDPSEVLATPSGRRGYVSVRGENKVKELDLRRDCPRLTGREAFVGTQPDTLQLTGDGATLVVTLRGTPARIALLDTRSFAVRAVDIPGHTTTGHHWLSANGKLSYIAVESPAGIAVVHNGSGAVLADYPYPSPPGGTRAHGVYAIPRSLR